MSAPFRMSELVELLHSRHNQWKVMALLRAYFDESGLHENARARVTGVSGFIGPADEWIQLENEWESELARFANDSGHDITHMHAYDCVNGQDFWFGIDSSIREAYYRRLARVLVKYTGLKGVSFSVELDKWDRYASPEFKDRYKSAYQLCAEHCFQQVASYSTNRAAGTNVALVFAEHSKYTDHLKEVFSYYMSSKMWSNIKSLTFASPVDCTPLQCADMISYESWRHWKEIESGNMGRMVDRPAFGVEETGQTFDDTFERIVDTPKSIRRG